MRVLFQNATVVTKCNNFNEKCDRRYKLRRLLQNVFKKASLLTLDYSQCAQLVDSNNCKSTCTFKANCLTSSQFL